MIVMLVGLIVGILLSFAYLAWTRVQPDAGRRLYAIGLLVTALMYVGFAVIGRADGHADARSLAVEAGGALLYIAAAWLGYRRSLTILAFGWALHTVWDVALHLEYPGAGYTPVWYPWFCISFDLVVAGAVFVAGARAERVISR